MLFPITTPCPRLISWLFLATTFTVAGAGRPSNVLLICVDDLRPELGCYGSTQVLTPNIDHLAARGLRFDRAFVQVAQCGPSRLNLMTGLRPDTTRVYALSDPPFDRRNFPDTVTLGEHFKQHGYRTQAIGKVFHNGRDDPTSWTEPTFENDGRNFMFLYADEAELARRRSAGEPEPAPADIPSFSGYKITALQSPDVDDRALGDGIVADRAIAALQKSKDVPFLLSVGFYRPHLPFVAPQRYFDLYPIESIALPDQRTPPRDAPNYGWFNVTRYFNPEWRAQFPATAAQIFPAGNFLVPTDPKIARASNSAEFRSYGDVPLYGEIPERRQREQLQAYYACVSYVDAQVGRVLAELDRLGLADNTIVVLWGDHGWHLGEKGIWGKLTNYDLDTRIPLIIAPPGMSPKATSALVETGDIFPTLTELCGLPAANQVEGISMVPLLHQPNRPWKTAAFSQYPRSDEVMGRSIRTDRYRYVEWIRPNGEVAARELYDHNNDSDESINVAAQSAYGTAVQQLHHQLHAGWQAARPPLP